MYAMCNVDPRHSTLPAAATVRAVIALLAIGATAAACAPPFSELQSAKLVGPGRAEITPHISAVSFASEGESARIQNHLGIQAAVGVTRRLDLRLRLERVELHEREGGAATVLGGGPKLGVIEDRVALYLPLGFAFGENREVSESLSTHPTALLTLPLNRYIEVNGSAKALIPIAARESDILTALNLGVGLSSDLRRWAVRPEIGFLFNPGEEGRFMHLSLGATLFTGR